MKHLAPATYVLLAILLSSFRVANAHTPASSHVSVDVSGQRPELVVDVALIDVSQLVILDANNDGDVTWAELLAAQPTLLNKVLDATSLQRGKSACRLRPVPSATALVRYSAVPHVSLVFLGDCAAGAEVYTLSFDLMFRLDPGHRVLVKQLSASAASLSVLTAARPTVQFSSAERLPVSAMLVEGFQHILEGYDHLLFLLLLILPVSAQANLRNNSLRVAGIVTAFTVAHSITLAIATFGVVALPAGPVEVAIAASIVVAGLLNILRPGHRIGWRLAFGFGLLHGFGFAGALAELGLGGSSLLLQLLAFNAGVELGQLMIVALALPLLLLLSQWSRYRQMLVPGLSAAGAGMGLIWVLTRL